MSQEPKDLRLARRAYEAYHREQPQVWFDDLSHDYQMRWVNAIREVLKEHNQQSMNRDVKRIKRIANVVETIYKGKHKVARITSVKEADEVLSKVPISSNGRRDYSGMSELETKRAKNAVHYLAGHRRR